MRRLHLFEWEDQPWLPRVFRDFITDHLRFTQNEPMRRPVNAAIAERLRDLLTRTGSRRIIDLCGGAGGPLPTVSRILAEELQCPVEIVLTDLYPNARAFEQLAAASGGRLQPRLESTDAMDVPAELDGVRTLFTALHHFRPDSAQQILADAARKGEPIAVFEPLERSVRMMVLLGVSSFVRGLTHTPRVGRLTPVRFVLTYLVPLAPLMFAWDGVVSVVRSYTAEELSALAAPLSSDRYTWESGRFVVSGPWGPMPTTYLVGRPTA